MRGCKVLRRNELGSKRIVEGAAEKLGKLCVGVMHFFPVAWKPEREAGD
jgi:hypothetical protein